MVQADTRGLRVGVRRYVPGTLTPHVKGLSAEHMSNKTLAAFNRKMDRKGLYALDGKSCALVGNSGLLKQTSYGRDIDNHDVIFRFNAAPTKVRAHVERATSELSAVEGAEWQWWRSWSVGFYDATSGIITILDIKGRDDMDESCSIFVDHTGFPDTGYPHIAPTQGYEDIAGSLTDVRIINNGMGRELVKSVSGKMKSATLNEVHLTKESACKTP